MDKYHRDGPAAPAETSSTRINIRETIQCAGDNCPLRSDQKNFLLSMSSGDTCEDT